MDLLEVRDTVNMEIIVTETFRQHCPKGMESFKAALQALKQPRKPAQPRDRRRKITLLRKLRERPWRKRDFKTRMGKQMQFTSAS